MKRRGISILLGVCSVVMLLQGCSKGNASKANDICVDTNAEYIQLELTDKVHIAADITPYDKYKDGLSSYFLESYIDMGNVLDEESLQENVKLFKQDMYKVIENIEKNTEGTFSIEDKKITYFGDLRQCELDIPHTDEEGIIRSLIYIWYLDEAGNAFAPEVWFDCRDGETEATLGEHYLGRDILRYISKNVDNDLEFAKAEEAGQLWKSNLESIMGESLSDKYIVVSVDEEKYNMLSELGEADIEGYDEEFYQFFFFRSVDGFSWKRLQRSILLDEAGELEEGVGNQALGLYLMPMDEWPLVMDVDKNGIRFMELTANSELGEVYKEKKQVIDVNQVLERVREYFDVSYMENNVTVYNIELCYSSSFSDKNDGLVRNIVSPFWIVDYRMEGTEEACARLIYDAYTGEFLMEKEAVE